MFGTVNEMDIKLHILGILSLQTMYQSDTNRILHALHLNETVKTPPTRNSAPTTDVITNNQAPSVPSNAEFNPRMRSFTDWPKLLAFELLTQSNLNFIISDIRTTYSLFSVAVIGKWGMTWKVDTPRHCHTVHRSKTVAELC